MLLLIAKLLKFYPVLWTMRDIKCPIFLLIVDGLVSSKSNAYETI